MQSQCRTTGRVCKLTENNMLNVVHGKTTETINGGNKFNSKKLLIVKDIKNQYFGICK